MIRPSVTALLAALPLLLAAQPGPCDPQLVQPPSNPNGYRLRGDRCEGVYVQQVSGTPLYIASWTQQFEDYDASNPKPLRLEWEAPGGSRVNLRAGALRRRLYYRMDARPPARSSWYDWPVSLLASLGVSKEELGVTAWVQLPVDNVERDVYLPLRIRQQKASERAADYQLVIVSEVELKELYLTLGPTGGGPLLKDGEPLKYGYYPAGRPIHATVGGMKARGVYLLQIGATLAGGGSATAELRFYHASVRN